MFRINVCRSTIMNAIDLLEFWFTNYEFDFAVSNYRTTGSYFSSFYTGHRLSRIISVIVNHGITYAPPPRPTAVPLLSRNRCAPSGRRRYYEACPEFKASTFCTN